MKNIFLAMMIFALSTSSWALSKDYQNLTPFQKRNELWKNISSKPYAELPDLNSGVGIGLILSSIGTFSSLATSFDHTSDEMPVGRKKVIHPFGSVAPIKWIARKGNPYSGIFQSGGIGFARLSIAGDPNLLGMTTGMGLKILVNGMPSLNLQVMYSLDGQGDNNNFFAHNFTNDIPAPKSLILKPLVALFSLVQNPPFYLQVDHLAKINAQGKNAKVVVTPYSLIFAPAKDVKYLYESHSKNDFREELASLNSGTALYDIYAKRIKSDRTPVFIGQIVMDDAFVASEYADQKLFFQHHRN